MTAARSPLRIVYMGTPDFAVPALEKLIASSDHVVGVVTNPDRPRGRGKKLTPPPVKVAAERAGIEVYQPAKLRGPEVLEKLRAWSPDVIVVAAYGQILRTDVLLLPRYGCINIHASLLPGYRGAAPINWAIVNGEAEAGVTIMQMEKGLDTGPMLLKRKTPIEPLDTAQDLTERLADMGADLIVDVMRLIHLDSLNPIPQDDSLSSYAPMLKKSDGQIDFRKSAREVADLIRGMNPWPGTYAFLDNEGESEPERIKFHLAHAHDALANGSTLEVTPGTVIRADQDRLWIACGRGHIECLTLQAPGKRALPTADFLNGYALSAGQRFLLPAAPDAPTA
ncbi:methionyl-tRNA formyltransferase [Lujinxingia litoralis]|uniref:Methionyl-tRNA formyltransferase n=1 Tax=Lujinxingia litoralis TaxID=2211119 RepID=A0A328C311_9DELT|nr:methionyl-tRNA formyltransferase [Lujinxingia litoralis]RAL20177.1 methionyl-tRNA formyltransferase [Lujinxingia litoralis]